MMLRARVQQNKVEDARRLKFPGLRRRAPCRATQWMNRTAQGPKWKPESAALRSRLLRAYVYRSFVNSRRAQGCHRGVENGCQSVRQKAKSCGRGRKRCQFLLYRLFL